MRSGGRTRGRVHALEVIEKKGWEKKREESSTPKIIHSGS